MRKRRSRKSLKNRLRHVLCHIVSFIESNLYDLADIGLFKPSMNFTTRNGRKAKVLCRIVSDYMTENQSYSYLCLDNESNNTFIICCNPLAEWKDSFIPDYYDNQTAEV